MSLRNNFTDKAIIEAIKHPDGFGGGARELTKLGRGKVSRQILRYWAQSLSNNIADDVIEDDNFAKTESQKRTAQIENNRLRKITRDILDTERTKDDMLEGIKQAVKGLIAVPYYVPQQAYAVDAVNKRITIELLFSDLQIGKLMDTYNTQLAIARLKEYTECVLMRIEQYRKLGYFVEKIVFAQLGDIIESDKKHKNSARATDTGTATQLADAIKYVTALVIEPLAKLGVPMDCVCITGNHDHDDHGLNMFKPGKEHLSWPMYHAMRMIIEAKGYSHVKFIIPEGAFAIYDLYDTKVLYEHGVGVPSSEAGMRKRMGDRIKQVKQYINLFRMGDKHNICRYNNDTCVVNGAFFGDDRTGSEYSGICGYDGEPAQIMFAHVKRSDNFRSTIFDSFSIQLGHIL